MTYCLVCVCNVITKRRHPESSEAAESAVYERQESPLEHNDIESSVALLRFALLITFGSKVSISGRLSSFFKNVPCILTLY